MDLNVALPLASSILSFVFAAFLVDQWRARRRPYQLIWTIGMRWRFTGRVVRHRAEA